MNDFIDDIQTEFENFLYRAFIEIPQVFSNDINSHHDSILDMLQEVLENTHDDYLIEEEREERRK